MLRDSQFIRISRINLEFLLHLREELIRVSKTNFKLETQLIKAKESHRFLLPLWTMSPWLFLQVIDNWRVVSSHLDKVSSHSLTRYLDKRTTEILMYLLQVQCQRIICSDKCWILTTLELTIISGLSQS